LKEGALMDIKTMEEKLLASTINKTHSHLVKRKSEAIRQSKENPILRWAGTWQGDDIDQLLEEVYALRSEVKF
jgi:hypothetical protein